MLAVAPNVPTKLITIGYNDAVYGDPGMVWVILHDNSVLAWLVDEVGDSPAVPIIVGSLPEAVTGTDPILSPVWAVKDGSTLFVPDMARGSPHEFFTFIATNNGAHRAIYANFADGGLMADFQSWGRANPGLALSAPPNVAPPA